MKTLHLKYYAAIRHYKLNNGMNKLSLALIYFVISLLANPVIVKARITSPLNNNISASIIAESGLGTISGRVTGDLLPLKGAKLLLLKNDEIVATTETDADGHYSFTYLEPGYYDLKGTKDGFRTAITNTIPSKEDQETKLDFYMPKFNNKNMNRYPIVESFHASQRRSR